MVLYRIAKRSGLFKFTFEKVPDEILLTKESGKKRVFESPGTESPSKKSRDEDYIVPTDEGNETDDEDYIVHADEGDETDDELISDEGDNTDSVSSDNILSYKRHRKSTDFYVAGEKGPFDPYDQYFNGDLSESCDGVVFRERRR